MNETRIERVTLAVIGLCYLFFSGAVIVSLIYLLMVLGSLVTIRPAFAQSTAGVRLEAGIEKEEVDGDLKSAMEVYQKIAADSSAPRDVRSKALLRLAGCYEKLGRQARQVYEQIARDFADQPAAAQARSRLAALKQQEHPAPPATMTVRKIEWSAVGGMGASDTDGQRAVYQDSGGNLFFGDLAGRTKRMIFKAAPGDWPGWVPSRDFSMVYLMFAALPNRPARLAVVKTDGTGYRELVRDDSEATILGKQGNWSAFWSWDSRYLAVRSNRQEGSGHLFVVSAADGQRRELLSTDTGRFTKAMFSPDGRFIAYEVMPLPEHSGTSHVFVVPVQGGEPRQVYESVPRTFLHKLGWENWTLLDWTADGRYLALSDAPKGKAALYLLPIKNGAAVGAPAFVRYGDFQQGYTTATGALVYEDQSTKPGGSDVFLASFDADGHLGIWRRLDLRSLGRPGLNPFPSFSSDGNQIIYTAQDEERGAGHILIAHDLASAQERVLYRSANPLACQSAARHIEVYCTERKEGGRTDLVSVAVESGGVKQLESFNEPPGWDRAIVGSTHDDKALYLEKQDLRLTSYAPGPIVRWDLATKEETGLSSPSDVDQLALPFQQSMDDRWLLAGTLEGLFVRPLSGGGWKSLASGNCWPYLTTPDGNWVLYRSIDAAGKHALFRVPTGGGQPQRLGDFPVQSVTQGMWLSPDGRQLLVLHGDANRYDLWVLENFVPAVKQ
jgi:Tol biopolymer transport system component